MPGADMVRFTRIVPRGLLPSSQATKRLVTNFAERSGMVYFGFVSQRSDDHHIVRGLTVSTQHVDDHYCIGTHELYDVVFVERSDALKSGKLHVWHIMEFDLKTTADIPHFFIGSSRHGNGFHELLDIKYPTLQAVPLGATSEYPKSFSSYFDSYVTPAHLVTMERLITPEIAETIADHFKGFVMEVTEQALFVYSEKPHLSAELLDTMLQNGVWLAKHIDENSRNL
jgi:hypothetical protein